jgi:hypothetical protein
VSDIKKTLRELERLKAKNDEAVRRSKEAQEKRVTTIRMNKRTQRIRFEGETEDQVTVIIEPKVGQ